MGKYAILGAIALRLAEYLEMGPICHVQIDVYLHSIEHRTISDCFSGSWRTLLTVRRHISFQAKLSQLVLLSQPPTEEISLSLPWVSFEPHKFWGLTTRKFTPYLDASPHGCKGNSP
jgi:hypothetical protein